MEPTFRSVFSPSLGEGHLSPQFQALSPENLRGELPAGLRRELLSLASESDPIFFYEGLLAIAERQEASGHQDLAVELYSGMLREGEAGTAGIPVSLRRRAQERLDAILGRGALGPRAEYLLRNFAQQASDPSMIFAMGAAGAVFRMTRLAVLSRLTLGSQAGVLTQVLGAGRIASLAGFALEAPTFTAAARLGSAVLGRPMDWSGGSWGRDLASSYLLLGGLRLAGWGSGAVSRGLAGSNGTGNAALRGLLQQGGMLTGIMAGHRMEEALGLRPQREGATVLLDSLATLLQFNVAGRLSHQAFGSRWSAWERSLELRASTLNNVGDAGNPMPPIQPVLRGGALSPAIVAPRTSGFERPMPHILWMAGGDSRGKGEDSIRTLPFIHPEGEGPSPLEIQHPMQLGRRILDRSLRFEERLKREDVVFELSSGAFDVEPYIPSLLQHLNRLLQSHGETLPIGRKVILNIRPDSGNPGSRIILLRGVRGFERLSEPKPQVIQGPGRASPYAPTLLAIPIQSVLPVSGSTAPKASRPVPYVAQASEEIPGLLRLLAAEAGMERKTRSLIVEDLNWTDTELNPLTRGMGPEFPKEMSFEVFFPASQTTLQGIILGENLHWLNQFRVNLEWKRLEGRTSHNPLSLEGLEQLYQQIYFLGRVDPTKSPEERILRLGGPQALGSFSEFVRGALNKYRVPGSVIRLESESGELLHRFSREGGLWTETRSSKKQLF